MEKNFCKLFFAAGTGILINLSLETNVFLWQANFETFRAILTKSAGPDSAETGMRGRSGRGVLDGLDL